MKGAVAGRKLQRPLIPIPLITPQTCPLISEARAPLPAWVRARYRYFRRRSEHSCAWISPRHFRPPTSAPREQAFVQRVDAGERLLNAPHCKQFARHMLPPQFPRSNTKFDTYSLSVNNTVSFLEHITHLSGKINGRTTLDITSPCATPPPQACIMRKRNTQESVMRPWRKYWKRRCSSASAFRGQ